MTHFCSVRLTHTKNAFCRRARDGASDIIHAEGARGDFPSSAPKARNALTSQGEAACAGERIDQGLQGQPAPHLPCGKETPLPATERHQTGRGGGSLLASKVGSFLASAEAFFDSQQGFTILGHSLSWTFLGVAHGNPLN
jgi:hypothetical protein